MYLGHASGCYAPITSQGLVFMGCGVPKNFKVFELYQLFKDRVIPVVSRLLLINWEGTS